MDLGTVSNARRRLGVIGIKSLHSLIYLVMSASILYVVVCGLVGRRDVWLAVAVGLVTLECLVYLGNRARCPLSDLAVRLGDDTGNDYLSDWICPRPWIRHTARIWGGVFGVGVVLVLLSWVTGRGGATP